jgi:hypothetical protein
MDTPRFERMEKLEPFVGTAAFLGLNPAFISAATHNI